MAESVRELVVTLSLQAGSFNKTCTDINNQIKGVKAEFDAITAGVDNWQSTMDGRKAKLAALNETLGLQQQKISTIATQLEAAKKALEGDPGNLGAAQKVSSLETQLNNAKAAATNTAAEIKKINLISLQQFGNKLTTMGTQLKNFGRKFSMYVGGPLAALGIKSYNAALDFESAMVTMQKTVEETDTTSYDDISNAFLRMSETGPIPYTDLMELAGAAGALGVGADNIVQFVASVSKLSVTADDLDAFTGATALAKLMNITEQGDYSNIENVASALTDLGNKTNATEGEILEMAQRMASTGELAGMTTTDILAMAAGFTSVGINAEAGGSAAGKLMKKMQAAAEVGTKAVDTFAETNMTAGMSIREIQLAADNSKWVAGLASEMGKTKAEVKDMIDAMVALKQFSSVMGVTPADYAAGWDASAGQSILDFFAGLNAIEAAQGEDTVLSALNEMGLTEIRLSNLIAAAATNPELFENALAISDEAYENNVALSEEAEKRFATAESHQQTQMNIMENAAADVGENVVDVVQPVIDKVTALVGEFGKLDEATQTRWVAVGASLIALGPLAATIGTVASGVGKIITWATKITPSGVTNWEKMLGALSNPILLGVAVGGALLLAYDYISKMPGELDAIATKASNIPINLDPASVSEMNRIIDETQKGLDKLRGGETTEAGEANTTAVTQGYGTQNMFSQAVGYESTVFEGTKQKIITDYSGQIAEVEAAIKANPLDTGNTQRLTDIATLEAEMSAAVTAAETAYTAKMSGLYNGMISQMGDTQTQMTQAAGTYDLFAAVYDALNNPAYEEDTTEQIGERFHAINEKAVALGFTDRSGSDQYAGLMMDMLTEIGGSMNTLTADLGAKGYGLDMLQAILNDPTVTAGLDLTKIEGALEGAVALLDWKAAGQAASSNNVNGDFGEYLSQGLADGVTANTGTVEASMYTTRDKTLEALQDAFEIKSPSQLMARQGVQVAAGVAQGILDGIPQAVAAMHTMGAALEAAAAARGAAAGAVYGQRFGDSASITFGIAIRKIKAELDRLQARINAGVGGQ